MLSYQRRNFDKISSNKIIQYLSNARTLFISVFIFVLILNPLSLPNWWILDDPVHKIDSLSQNIPCGTRFDQQFVDLNEVFVNKTSGGQYRNNDCKFSQKIAIIVPYRNRSEHLKVFLNHIHHFLLTQNTAHYRIIVVEQLDNGPFNRGALLNIGFQQVIQNFPTIDCFIFHDVDVLPMDFRQQYVCSTVPRHLCSYLDKMRYVLMYKGFFGVVVAMNRKQFEDINGFSNVYFGWGGEDDDLYMRIMNNFKYFERYDSIISRCHMIRHEHNSQEADDRLELLDNSVQRMSIDGLNNIHQFYTGLKIDYYRLYTKFSVKFIQNKHF